MQEKEYKFKTFDRDGNELSFDMTELQYLVKEEFLKYEVPTCSQVMEILRLSNEQARTILASDKSIMEYNKQLLSK